jgi:sulfonate transport system substrate-binding protein
MYHVLVIFLSLFLVVTTARADVPVRIGWLKGTNDLTLAKARGTLERALAETGARVEWAGPFPAAAPAIEALNADAIDITVGSSTSSIAALAARAPIVIFAYQPMGADAEALIVKTDSPIHRIEDLAGHSVAVNRGGTGEYLLMQALQRHGVDPALVRRVYLGPADAAPVFASGSVDAWAAWDPFLSVALMQYGARVLANGHEIGSQNAIVMVASRAFVTQHRSLLKTIYDTLRSDNTWSLANPHAAGLVWTHELHLPDVLAPVLGTHNAMPTVAVGPQQAAQIASIAQWYVQSGIVPSVPDVGISTLDLSQ